MREVNHSFFYLLLSTPPRPPPTQKPCLNATNTLLCLLAHTLVTCLCVLHNRVPPCGFLCCPSHSSPQKSLPTLSLPSPPPPLPSQLRHLTLYLYTYIGTTFLWCDSIPAFNKVETLINTIQLWLIVFNISSPPLLGNFDAFLTQPNFSKLPPPPPPPFSTGVS